MSFFKDINKLASQLEGLTTSFINKPQVKPTQPAQAAQQPAQPQPQHSGTN